MMKTTIFERDGEQIAEETLKKKALSQKWDEVVVSEDADGNDLYYGFCGKCPMISFVYRKGQLFNVAGEKFSEEDARCTIEKFEKAFLTFRYQVVYCPIEKKLRYYTKI